MNDLIKRADFLHVDTNLGKLIVDLIIKWMRPFRSYGTLKSGALTNDLMNRVD